MYDYVPYEAIMERVKDDIDYIAEQAYERGKRDILEQLQSTLPEREKGHWVKDGHHIECNKSILTECPFCGGPITIKHFWKDDNWSCGCFNKSCKIRPMTKCKETMEEAKDEWENAYAK